MEHAQETSTRTPRTKVSIHCGSPLADISCVKLLTLLLESWTDFWGEEATIEVVVGRRGSTRASTRPPLGDISQAPCNKKGKSRKKKAGLSEAISNGKENTGGVNISSVPATDKKGTGKDVPPRTLSPPSEVGAFKGCSARRSLPQRRPFQCDARLPGEVRCTTIGLSSLLAKVQTCAEGGVEVELRCQNHAFDGEAGKKIMNADFKRFMEAPSSQGRAKSWNDWYGGHIATMLNPGT